MLNVARDIHSLTEFKRNTTTFLDELRASRRTVLLTVNGKAELAVMSARTFQFVLDSLDQLDTIQGIQRGLEQVRQGDGASLVEFEQTMREKHELPGP